MIVCFNDKHPELARWRWRATPDDWQRDDLFTMLTALGALQQKPEGNNVGQQ